MSTENKVFEILKHYSFRDFRDKGNLFFGQVSYMVKGKYVLILIFKTELANITRCFKMLREMIDELFLSSFIPHHSL